MKHPGRLLNAVLEETASPDFRADVLARALGQLQRRRRQRLYARGIAVLGAFLAAGAGLWMSLREGDTAPTIAATPATAIPMLRSRPLEASAIVHSTANSVALVVTNSRGVRVIESASDDRAVREVDDDDLLALFKGRAVALVRQGPHEAALVLLDEADWLKP
ncbi:MAG: hypothetical protein U1G07_04370 [Verrucomicrobiota bacterium]